MLPVHHKVQPHRRGNTVYLLLVVLLSAGLLVEFGYWRKQIARLVVINEQLRRNAAELRAQNDKLSSSVADQKDALHSVMKQNSQLDGETRAIQDALHRHEEQVKAANDQLSQSNAKVKELQGRVAELQRERDAYEKESAQNLKEVASITNQLEECSNELAAESAKAVSVVKPGSDSPVVNRKPSTTPDSTTQPSYSTPSTNSDSQEMNDASDQGQAEDTPETVANEGGSVDPVDLVAPDENKSPSEDEEQDGVASRGTVSRSKASFNPDESNDTQEESRTVEET